LHGENLTIRIALENRLPWPEACNFVHQKEELVKQTLALVLTWKVLTMTSRSEVWARGDLHSG
jgi:hypothetical protein